MIREIRTRFFLTAAVLLLVQIYVPATCAQEPQPTPLTAPPPFKVIPKEERLQIEQTRDAKKRLKLTIELAVNHLALAEQLTDKSSYDDAAAQVGMYHALVENALEFLSTFKRDSNKTRDLYKRLELALRAHGPRLTSMRRITPIEFAVWIKRVEDFARASRTEALNSFYGHTVVRDPKKTSADKQKEPKDPQKTDEP